MSDPISISDRQRDFQRDPEGVDSGWLEDSWGDPDSFWAAVFALHRGSSPVSPKSALGERYDIYHDAVIRHLGGDRVALRWWEGRRGWQACTYEALHARAGELARAWTGSGVKAAAIVAVVLPFGIDYVVAVLTALRLGACVAPLPPVGRAYVGRRLSNLGPTHIATTSLYHGMLSDFSDMLIGVASGPASPAPGAGDLRGGPGTYDRSHTYAAGDPCALLFSPLRDPSDEAAPLSCDDLYLRAVRDGLLLHGLGSGEHLAAPGFSPLQYQPGLVLAALLTGATYVHLPAAALRDAPERLMDWPLRSLGISSEVRDLLLSAQLGGPPPWEHWFRDPEETDPWTAWQELIESYSLKKVPASNAIIEAAAGGALAVSRVASSSARLETFMNLHPAPGVPWALLDANQSGQETAGDVGVYAYGAGEPVLSHVLLSRLRGAAWIYTGNPQPRRAGWVYPEDEVIEALADLPFVDAASVVQVPGGTLQWRFVLLVFTGYQGAAAPAKSGPRQLEIERLISARVGDPFLPDRIEMVPLFARRTGDKDGAVDHGWCRQQYFSGSLYRKARMPVFTHLTALRAALCEDPLSQNQDDPQGS